MVADTLSFIKKNVFRSDFDHPWKHAFAYYLRDFLELCLPHIAQEIHWSKGYQSLEKELIAITRDAEVGHCVVDKLIRVSKKENNAIPLLIHLEVEGSAAYKLPKRMMIYRYRIYDVHHLPIISIAILIDEDPKFRVDQYREECFGTYQEIHYLVVKLLDYQRKRQELEETNNRFAVILLAQLTVLETKKDMNARLNAKLTLMRSLYKKNYKKQDIIQLYILVDWIITLPEELVVEYEQALKQFEEERRMGYITTFERLGIEKGYQQGLTQGLEQGLNQGKADLLIRLLQHRFHSIPSIHLERIKRAGPETLLIWGERVLEAQSLEEIFN